MNQRTSVARRWVRWLPTCAIAIAGCAVYDDSLLVAKATGDARAPVGDESAAWGIDVAPSETGRGGSGAGGSGAGGSGAAGAGGAAGPGGASGSGSGGSIQPPGDGGNARYDAADVARPEASDANSREAGDATARDAGGREVQVVDAAEPPPDVSDAHAPREASAAPEGGPCAGMALRLDGTTAYASAKLLSGDDFTIEAWIRTTMSRPGTAAYQGLGLVYADVAGTASDFAVSLTNGNIAMVIGNPDTTLFSNTVVTTGKWVHMAVTRKRSTGSVAIYVDGKLDKQTVASNTSALTASSALTIGANLVNSRFYVGDLDEFRHWNVVRTAAQIAASLNKRLNGDESGLEEYYRFDQTGGTTVLDLSSTKAAQNDAVVTGAALFIPSDAPLVCD